MDFSHKKLYGRVSGTKKVARKNQVTVRRLASTVKESHHTRPVICFEYVKENANSTQLQNRQLT